MTKHCPRCRVDKPHSAFRVRAEGTGRRLYTHCRQCETEIRQESRKLLQEATPKPQACESCGDVRPLQLDHCHTTKTFRGWICAPCNTAYGMVGTFERLEKLYEYAKKTRNSLDKVG